MKHVAVAFLLTLGLVGGLPGVAHAQTTVTFPDPNLEAAVRAALAKPSGDLTTNDMLSLGALPAENKGISNLQGLEWALNLQHLDLAGNTVQDAGPLAGLTGLQTLFLDGNHLSSGVALAGLTNLTSLLANDNSIHDTSWLTGLTQLQELGLIGNPLGNGAALAGLTNLTDLYVNSTSIPDLNWVSGLTNLVRLGVGENGVTDASPLQGLSKLEFLGLGGSPLTSCAPLAALNNLTTLYLYRDGLTDISCLAGLSKLTWLRVADNQLSDVSPLAGLHALQYLDLNGNPLANCAPLAGLTQLVGLDLGYTHLTNVSCLSGLTRLAYLGMGNNQITDASPLASLTGLQELYLSNNLIANLDFAQGMTALTNLDVANNQLTQINGLLGATSLSSVDLLDNPLTLSPGSPALSVITALQGRGVNLEFNAPIIIPPPAYVPTNAVYNGLFYVGDAITYSNSGSITLTTTSKGKYTGRLRMGTGSYAFSGSLSTNGTAKQFIKRGRLHLLTVALAMQDVNDLGGTVSASSEAWTADIVAYRVVYDGKSKLAPQRGRYTLAIASGDSLSLPDGNGFGTLTVNPAGQLNFTGSLADGTAVSQSAGLSGNGQWPVFIPLAAGKGSVVSWIGFTNAQTLGGEVAWTKPGGSKRYPLGFSWLTEAKGARYTPPGRGTNVFGTSGSSLALTLAGGGLKQDLAGQFTLNAKNQLKDLVSTNRLALSFTPSSGLFRGSALDPASRKRVSFSGVVLQNLSTGYGYFLGTTNSGQVLLSP